MGHASRSTKCCLGEQGKTQCVIFTNASHGGYWWDVGVEYRKLLGNWLDTTFSQKPR